jgi:hypothetical protein
MDRATFCFSVRNFHFTIAFFCKQKISASLRSFKRCRMENSYSIFFTDYFSERWQLKYIIRRDHVRHYLTSFNATGLKLSNQNDSAKSVRIAKPSKQGWCSASSIRLDLFQPNQHERASHRSVDFILFCFHSGYRFAIEFSRTTTTSSSNKQKLIKLEVLECCRGRKTKGSLLLWLLSSILQPQCHESSILLRMHLFFE